MKKILLLIAIAPLYALLTAFCGFYVAKADASLFNKASQVILARSGDQTVVTMQSDFQGSVNDFAMIIPVPVVPEKKDIRVTDISVFDKLDAYSGPRLVEYYDEAPCEESYEDDWDGADDAFGDFTAAPEDEESGEDASSYGVRIEASYSVGEYDILILGATESSGLEKWLKREGYNIPKGASEALEPYVKNGLKFFVVKVNLDEFNASDAVKLRPIQVTYRTEKFMLPIRLGMANSKGTQDMIVYILTDQGRAEVTNYRTVEMPTDRNVPVFVEDEFGTFYTRTFTRAWENAGKDAVMLEYAWNIDGSQSVKCDPCPTPPLVYTDLREAGAFWVNNDDGWGGGGEEYFGELFITRLHVRYDRKHFPQDLEFQVTPNQEHFQARYVLQQPAMWNLDCKEAIPYLQSLITRRKEELKAYSDLTGVLSNNNTRKYLKEAKEHYDTTREYQGGKEDKGIVIPFLPGGPGPWIGGAAIMIAFGGLRWFDRRFAPRIKTSRG